MEYQVVTDKNNLSTAHLVYFSKSSKEAILVDPFDTWEDVHAYLKEHSIQLKYILLTEPSFEKAFRVAAIKLQTGAKLLSFQPDLLQLRTLPKKADEVNVCGIKIPHVDGFLKDNQQVNLGGVDVQVSSKNGHHEYRFSGEGLTTRTFSNNP